MNENKEFIKLLKEKNTKLLLHFPHVGLDIPNHFYDGLLINYIDLLKYIIEMSDYAVDNLFNGLNAKKIKSKYSRLYCDVERFKDDRLEEMSKYGQGVVYTHTYDNILFHKHDEKYKNKVLRYYDKYHKRFEKETKKILDKGYNLLILDCHSFSDKMASYIKEKPFPDICIGVEEDFNDIEILNYIKNGILRKGYKYQINYPYKGSIVPNYIYNNKEKYKNKVVSIMIEINKKIYLPEDLYDIKKIYLK